MSKPPSQEILCSKCKTYRAKHHQCYGEEDKPLVIDLEPDVIYRRRKGLRTRMIDINKGEETFEVVEDEKGD